MVAGPDIKPYDEQNALRALTEMTYGRHDENIGIGSITIWFVALFVGLGIILIVMDHNLLAKTMAQAVWACAWAISLTSWARRRRVDPLTKHMNDLAAESRLRTLAIHARNNAPIEDNRDLDGAPDDRVQTSRKAAA